MTASLRFDLVDLRLFLHVTDTGSITAGSKLSHLALASASARIRGMEDALGVALLERLRSGVKPTKAGLAVAHHARLVLQQLDRMHGEIDDYAGGMAGKVRLLSNTAAITDYLPEALAAFLNAHPAIDVELEERTSHAIVLQLLSQAGDLGIVADSTDTSQLETQPFRRDRLVLVASRQNIPGRSRHISFADALHHDFVGLGEDSAMQQHLDAQAGRLGLRMRTRIRLRSFEAVCRMVEAGVGVAVVPAIAAQRYAGAGRLRILKLDDAWADRELLVCARKFADLSAPALKLVDALCATGAGQAT
ncbi:MULTISPECIES: LysR family transcriptional regulator [unclassified Polaromonas]|uniref:LysR family transcriptional regulator n=1 Tax=unclassified Polaromonas TaxID=2638319 RepID=UPI000F0976DE|nr:MULTISPECIES: LysR family transcriptional regulator [unclassified Polaromonas]AYQ27333.1 LysR family transcriptional regulator [Polaromonas sp. SP1]QGJ17826.1 LysR family transcriptional regulator [Polaromonas sp. Pch-P]